MYTFIIVIILFISNQHY